MPSRQARSSSGVGRQAPVEPVAELEVVGPFAVAEQVGARGLDLDDHQLALGVDSHQVGAPAVAQRHLGERPDVVAREQPADAAGDRARAPGVVGKRHGGHAIGHDFPVEQKRNEVNCASRRAKAGFMSKQGSYAQFA
jgi:hypothetical protein